MGYGIYDLFDLGEFDQIDSSTTKDGTRAEYEEAMQACQAVRIEVYADAVVDHKMWADKTKDELTTSYDPSNRNRALEGDQPVRALTLFQLEARGDQYSSMKRHWYHFDAVDGKDARPYFRDTWKIQGASFKVNVGLEKGNDNYLMGRGLTINHPEVRGKLKHWGRWMLDTIGVDGFRLDVIKHTSSDVFHDWIESLDEHRQQRLFVVGEDWNCNLPCLSWYVANTSGRMHLFDAPQHHNVHLASRSGGHYYMGRLLDGSLMQTMPLLAVTLMENHDTQPLREPITTNGDGWAEWRCPAGSVSVWVEEAALAEIDIAEP